MTTVYMHAPKNLSFRILAASTFGLLESNAARVIEKVVTRHQTLLQRYRARKATRKVIVVEKQLLYENQGRKTH
jgi:hypothetical protein